MRKSLGHSTVEALLFGILASMLLLNVLVTSVNAPVIEVDPPSVTIEAVGLTETVDITVTGVTNLFAWQLYLKVNDSVATLTAAWLPLLTDPEYVFYGQSSVRPFPEFYDKNANGKNETLKIGDSLMAVGSFTGSGLLCHINVTGVAVGTCDLEFTSKGVDTTLLDPDLLDITFTATNGNIEVIPEFPVFALIPLLVISTLVAVLIAKRKWLNKQYTSPRL